MIRESNLFVEPEAHYLKLTTLDGNMLHPSLVNFYLTSQRNFLSYLSDNDCELEPVFITLEDEKKYNDINNWTIQKIDEELAQRIIKVDNTEERESFQLTLKNLKGKKKEFTRRFSTRFA